MKKYSYEESRKKSDIIAQLFEMREMEIRNNADELSENEQKLANNTEDFLRSIIPDYSHSTLSQLLSTQSVVAQIINQEMFCEGFNCAFTIFLEFLNQS